MHKLFLQHRSHLLYHFIGNTLGIPDTQFLQEWQLFFPHTDGAYTDRSEVISGTDFITARMRSYGIFLLVRGRIDFCVLALKDDLSGSIRGNDAVLQT